MEGFAIVACVLLGGQGLVMLMFPAAAREIYIAWRGMWGLIISPDSPMLSNPVIRFFGLLSLGMAVAVPLLISQEDIGTPHDQDHLHVDNWFNDKAEHMDLSPNAAESDAAEISPSTALIQTYHRAEPPNALFLEVLQAEEIGDISRYRLLCYSFTWSGSETSIRSSHKLLVFDRATGRYLASYILHVMADSEASYTIGNTLHLLLSNGDSQFFDFTTGLPD